MNLKTLILFVISIYSCATFGYLFSKNSSYQVCFVPSEKCDQELSSIIYQAKDSVYVQAYHLTNKKILIALIEAHSKGVGVQVILDKSAAKEGFILKMNGIPVTIDKDRAIAHNKVMIIDRDSVVTGSFNFTESAQRRNVENYIYIKDAALSEKYYDNFQDRLHKSYQY